MKMNIEHTVDTNDETAVDQEAGFDEVFEAADIEDVLDPDMVVEEGVLVGSLLDKIEDDSTVRIGEMEAIEQQEKYIELLDSQGFDYGLIMAEAFVRGMRDIGYKSSGTAIDEQIDNSIEAGADRVSVLFGYDPNSDKKPARLAIIDNGHGMTPAMIRAAVLWGGGTREDRRMFGRYGYGLPSSCVSLGKRFTVFSRVVGADEWYAVTIDLDEIAAGTFGSWSTEWLARYHSASDPSRT